MQKACLRFILPSTTMLSWGYRFMDSAGIRIEILIADRDNMAGQLMAGALKRCRNLFEVVGVATSSADAISQVEAQKPNIALISPELSDGAQSGFKVLQT